MFDLRYQVGSTCTQSTMQLIPIDRFKMTRSCFLKYRNAISLQKVMILTLLDEGSSFTFEPINPLEIQHLDIDIKRNKKTNLLLTKLISNPFPLVEFP